MADPLSVERVPKHRLIELLTHLNVTFQHEVVGILNYIPIIKTAAAARTRRYPRTIAVLCEVSQVHQTRSCRVAGQGFRSRRNFPVGV